MSPLTSIAGGVLLCALVGALTNQHYPGLTLGCAALGALLPHWLERRWLTERLGPHTLTHSLLGLVICGVLLGPLLLTPHHSLLTACLIGYAAHLLLDAATERGIPLFYPSHARAVLPRHPLSRIVPGSPRERRLRWWLLGGLVLALPLNAMGLRGLLHRLIPVTQFAVEDAITYASHGHQVFVDFTGRFTASQRLVCGRWEVLDPRSSTSLLVEDPHGTRYILGTHPHDTIQVFTIRARKGPPLTVRLQRIRLHDQTFSDLLPLIPAEGRTYLIGSVQTPEALLPHVLVDQFQPIQVGNQRIEFHYATARDLHDAQLSGLYVAEGEVLLRTLIEGTSPASSEPVAMNEIPSSAAPHRTVSLTLHHLAEPSEILVKPGQPVTRGQLLVDLAHHRRALLPEYRTTHARLAAAQSALAQLRLAHEQELSLKRTEDALAGISRDLLTLHAQHHAELTHAQAQVEALSAKLAGLDRDLAATKVRAPVTGRVLAIQLQPSTAILHLLADD